jgi:hypothetical protein
LALLVIGVVGAVIAYPKLEKGFQLAQRGVNALENLDFQGAKDEIKDEIRGFKREVEELNKEIRGLNQTLSKVYHELKNGNNISTLSGLLDELNNKIIMSPLINYPGDNNYTRDFE